MANHETVGVPHHRSQRSSTWENNQRYGIVHCLDCDICDLYKEHVADAAFDNQLSFQMARDDLKRQYEIQFSKGIAEGRHLEQLNNQEELHKLRDENASLRVELVLAQVQCEQLQKSPVENVPGRAFDLQCMERGDVFGNIDRLHSALLDQPIRPPSCTGSASSATSFATPLDGADMSLELAQCPASSSVGSKDLTHSPAVSAASIALSIEADRLPQPRPFFPIASSTQQMGENLTGTTTGSIRDLHDGHLHSTDGPFATASQPLQAAERKRAKPVKNLKEMNMLIRAAREPYNWAALNKCKRLLREAHATTKVERTSVQNHLIKEWRSVEWDDGTHATRHSHASLHPRAINPRKEDPPEAWQAYFVACPESIPLGIRRDDEGVPLLSDLKAFRTVSRLKPEKSSSSSETLKDFKPAVARLFSIHDAYQESLMRLGTTIADEVTYIPYNGPPDVTLDDISAHFAACGITNAMADAEMGPWAREYLSVLPTFHQARA